MAANDFPGNPNPPPKPPNMPASKPPAAETSSAPSTGQDISLPSPTPPGNPGAPPQEPWSFVKNNDGKSFQAFSVNDDGSSKDMGSISIPDADKVLDQIGTFNKTLNAWEVPPALGKELTMGNLPLPDYLKEKFGLGKADIAQGAIGLKFLNGELSPQDALARAQPGLLEDQLKGAPVFAWQGLGPTVADIWAKAKDAGLSGIGRGVAGGLAESLPGLEDMAEKGVGTAAVVGLGAGALALGAGGPDELAAPEIIAGIKGMAKVGGAYGVFKSVFDQSAGTSAIGMLQKGYDPATIKKLAPLEGALNGALMVGAADLLTVPYAKAYVSKILGNEAIQGALARYISSTASGTTLMAAQTAVHEAVDRIAASLDNMPAAADKQPFSAIVNSAIQSAPVMAALGLPGGLLEAAGHRAETAEEARNANEVEDQLKAYQTARQDETVLKAGEPQPQGTGAPIPGEKVSENPSETAQPSVASQPVLEPLPKSITEHPVFVKAVEEAKPYLKDVDPNDRTAVMAEYVQAMEDAHDLKNKLLPQQAMRDNPEMAEAMQAKGLEQMPQEEFDALKARAEDAINRGIHLQDLAFIAHNPEAAVEWLGNKEAPHPGDPFDRFLEAKQEMSAEETAHEALKSETATPEETLNAVDKAAEKPPKPTLEQQTRDVESKARIAALEHDLKDTDTLIDHLAAAREDYVNRGIPTRALDSRINAAIKEAQGYRDDLKFYQTPGRENALVTPKEHLWMKPATLEDIINTAEQSGRASNKVRAQQIKDLASENNLTRLDVQKFLKNKPWSLMGDVQFKNFLNDFKENADKVNERKGAMRELQNMRREKQIEHEEYVRQLHDLPPMKKMTTDQIREYANILRDYDKGDEALSPKRIAALDTTALKGAKTQKDILELGAKLTGQPIADMMQTRIPRVARNIPDAHLREINPMLQFVVDQGHTIKTKTDVLADIFHKNWMELSADAARSRHALMGAGERIADWFAPQQRDLRAYIEEKDPVKSTKLAARLTPEELKAADFVRKFSFGAEDYLIKQGDLTGSRFSGYYVPHSPMKVAELLREARSAGLWNTIKEFLPGKDTAKFADAGAKALSLREFFEHAQYRSGELRPSENVFRVVDDYAKAFYSKVHYDQLAPLIDSMVRAAKWAEKQTNGGEEGARFNERLESFLRDYLNAQKGNSKWMDMQNEGLGESIMRGARAYASFHWIAGNAALQAVLAPAHYGTMGFMEMGPEGMARALARALSKGGQKLLDTDNVKAFAGESPLTELNEPSRDIGDTVQTALYGSFRFWQRKALQSLVLGAATKEELQTGEISDARLADIKLKAGRWMAFPDMASVAGRSEMGKTFAQFKQWAVPPLLTTVEDLTALKDRVLKGEKLTPDQAHDFVRTGMALTGALVLRSVLTPQMEDHTFIGRAIHYLRRGILTRFEALSGAELAGFLIAPSADLIVKTATDAGTLLQLERTKMKGFKGGELKGEKSLLNDLTPAIMKQLGLSESSNEEKK